MGRFAAIFSFNNDLVLWVGFGMSREGVFAANFIQTRNACHYIQSETDAVFFALFNQVAIAAKALKQRNFEGGKLAAIMDDSHVVASGGALNGTELYLFNPPGDAFIHRFKI